MKAWGLAFVRAPTPVILTPTMEKRSQMESQVENDTETGAMWEFMGLIRIRWENERILVTPPRN